MIPNFTVDFNSVQIEGKTYTASKQGATSCKKCAFNHIDPKLITPECFAIRGFCSSRYRPDMQDIIWILKEEKGN